MDTNDRNFLLAVLDRGDVAGESARDDAKAAVAAETKRLRAWAEADEALEPPQSEEVGRAAEATA